MRKLFMRVCINLNTPSVKTHHAKVLSTAAAGAATLAVLAAVLVLEEATADR